MHSMCYARSPLFVHDGIPVFSVSDAYTENYECIAADHLGHLDQFGTNPFIAEDLWVQMEDSTASLVSEYAKQGDMILDVGVGMGRLLGRFPELQRYGMDISMEYLRHASDRGIEVCYSLIEDMPYTNGQFDIVVCTDVLEHVLDLNVACAKILSVVRDDGVVIVRTPYREDLSGYLAPAFPYAYAHLRTFDESSLQLQFSRIFGCEFLEVCTAGYCATGRRLKYPIPFPKGAAILSQLLTRTRSLFPRSLYAAIIRQLFSPIEVNAVFRKNSSANAIVARFIERGRIVA